MPAVHDEDVVTFLDALILNWLIGERDAHAKNYSILIGGGGLDRPAPLYDIARWLIPMSRAPTISSRPSGGSLELGCHI